MNLHSLFDPHYCITLHQNITKNISLAKFWLRFFIITRTSRMWYNTWQIHDAIITSLWNKSTIMTLFRHVFAEYVLVDLSPDKAMRNTVFIKIEITIQETRCIWWIKCILQNVYIYIFFSEWPTTKLYPSWLSRGVPSTTSWHLRMPSLGRWQHYPRMWPRATWSVPAPRGACPLQEPFHPGEGRGRPG